MGGHGVVLCERSGCPVHPSPRSHAEETQCEGRRTSSTKEAPVCQEAKAGRSQRRDGGIDGVPKAPLSHEQFQDASVRGSSPVRPDEDTSVLVLFAIYFDFALGINLTLQGLEFANSIFRVFAANSSC